MALIQTMEATGAKLFKYRGQIPVLIFVLALPLIWLTNETLYSQLRWDLNVGAHTVQTICTVCGILLSLCGLALRAYTVCTTPKGTSGRNTASQVANTLNTKGIYSVVRHPLYFANYLIWAGILIFSMNAYAFIIVSLIYWFYYERIMMAEEAFLRGKFGNEFEEWASRVPAFFPKWSLYEGGMLEFSWKTFIRREYATWLSTILAYLVVDYNLFWRIWGPTYPDFTIFDAPLRPSFYIAAGYTIIALIIKLIKHKTTWLDATPDRD